LGKAIGILTTLLLAAIATDGSAAEPAPDLSTTQELIGIATYWDFTVNPFPGVEEPEISVYVALAQPANTVITPVPDGCDSAADAFGKGLRIWVDESTMEALSAPQSSDPIIIQPVAVAFAGEAAYGIVEAFGDDFVELLAMYDTEGGAEAMRRFGVASGTAIAYPLEIGAPCYIVYDAADVALMIMLTNG